MAPEEMDLVSGDDLNVLYQIWTAPSSKPQNLKATYTYGKLSGPSNVNLVADEFSGAQFDQAGSMINGKKLPTRGLDAGNFRLSITVTDPASNQKSFSNSGFRIVNSGEPQRFWRLYDETMADEVARGNVDLDRGRLYQAAKADDQALLFYRMALERNAGNHQARARLVDLLFAMKKYADIVAIFSRTPISKDDGEGIIVQYAESLAETGDTTRAIATLEKALQSGASSKPIYISLADCYKRAGNTAKAEEAIRKSEAAIAR
jgi:tetratricopeptide (TPR) repeat protein